MGVFDPIFAALSIEGGAPESQMIYSTRSCATARTASGEAGSVEPPDLPSQM